MIVVVSSYIFCVLLLFTCRGKVHIGKRTKIFVQKFLRMIGCKNGGFRNLSCLCTALLVQKVSKIDGDLSACSKAVCEFGPSYLLPNGLKSFNILVIYYFILRNGYRSMYVLSLVESKFWILGWVNRNSSGN